MSTMPPSNQGMISETRARRARVPSTPSTTRATSSQTHIHVIFRLGLMVASMARLAHTSPDMVKMCTAQAATRARAGYCPVDTDVPSRWINTDGGKSMRFTAPAPIRRRHS